MAQISFKGNPATTKGQLPTLGEKAPDFTMVKNDLSETNLYSYSSKFKVLNIFPSLDTGVCAMSVKHFNQLASEMEGVAVLNISKDLPFAQKRFCGAEGIDKVETCSIFRSDFLDKYHLELLDTPLKGLCSRAVIVLDKDNNVVYTQQVEEITSEPNYQLVLETIRS
ncbi:MAG: thiol peroxidase [Halobacteriovoraceae bacterium]|nr:thiol peroxidase [Halobacteriovoraceae bacterium]MCB9095295.1 thiol peroxidase [Halobacteriovoraceae bacterium]